VDKWIPKDVTPMTDTTQEIDHEYTDYPVCPHCGYEHLDWKCRGEGEEEEEDVFCESCDKLMDVSTNMTITYTTSKAPPRCGKCRGEKERPRQVGFKPQGGAVYCEDGFHEGAKR